MPNWRRERPRRLGRLKLAHSWPTSHVMWTPFSRSKVQVVADFLKYATYAGTGAPEANKNEDNVNLQGAEAYCVATHIACSVRLELFYSLLYRTLYFVTTQYDIIIL